MILHLDLDTLSMKYFQTFLNFSIAVYKVRLNK